MLSASLLNACGEPSLLRSDDAISPNNIKKPKRNPGNTNVNQNRFSVPLTVKWSGSHPLDSYPISKTIPFPFGQFHDLKTCLIKNNLDQPVPAFLKTVERWPKMTDEKKSIRNINAFFNAKSMSGFKLGRSETGIAEYKLVCHPDNIKISKPKPTNPVSLTPIRNVLGATLSNGLSPNVSLIKNQNSFDIYIDEDKVELNVTAVKDQTLLENSNVEISALPLETYNLLKRTDIDYEILELNENIAVIEIHSPGIVNDKTIHFGFTLLLKMRANSDHIELDMALENAALYDSKKNTTKWGAPVTFKHASIKLVPVKNQNTTSFIKSSKYLNSQTSHNSEFLERSTSNPLSIVLDQFSARGPNEYKRSIDGKLEVSYFPWNAQGNYQQGPKNHGLFHLDDLQISLHRIAISRRTGQKASQLAEEFENPPFAIIPPSTYRYTKHAAFGGLVPFEEFINQKDERRFETKSWKGNEVLSTHESYKGANGGGKVGYADFNPKRVFRSHGTGGSPILPYEIVRTGDPIHAQKLKLAVLYGALSRPEFMPKAYQYDLHYNIRKPTTAPYGGKTWARFDGHGKPFGKWEHAAVFGGFDIMAAGQDDPHYWTIYQLRSYLNFINWDYWIIRHLKSMKEFREPFLDGNAVFPSNSDRAIGHRIQTYLQAYRATGDEDFLSRIVTQIEGFKSQFDRNTGLLGSGSKTGFQLAYLSRSLIEYMMLTGKTNGSAFELVQSTIKATHDMHYSYYQSYPYKALKSSGSSGPMTDILGWLLCVNPNHSNKTDYLGRAVMFLLTGLNGGSRSYSSGDLLGNQFNRLDPKGSWEGPGSFIALQAPHLAADRCENSGFDPLSLKPFVSR